ncbi:hypothetical protein GE09DRAFT_965829 [Coniochaeta sp. 2T2.1]|nr:hypothetical protein GE09DRAFT_965829 [Coniochaeta sp. 2T2.1]
MRHTIIQSIILGLAAPGIAAAPCDRRVLKVATDRYLVAQSTGDNRWLESVLEADTTYWENLVLTNITNGTLTQALRIDHSRTSFDLLHCATYTELIATDPSRLLVSPGYIRKDPSTGKIKRLDGIFTTTGDLFFNASHTLHYTLLEDWSDIPVEHRDSRATLQAAADAYYDVFVNKTVSVPWGKPCTRLEGGYLDANGSCDTDIPEVDIRTIDRRYVIDETLGVVNVISNFGILGPDSHEFRILNGTIRQIHSMTLCRPNINCGVTVPAILSDDIGF